MSKFKRLQESEVLEEPELKRHKPKSPGTVESKRLSRPAPIKSLSDLPPELLEKIIGYVNDWEQNPMRGTSRRMREINDSFVMHEFTKILKNRIRNDPNSNHCAALKVIQQATEVFLRAGFKSPFCSCILCVIRAPQVNLNSFLQYFYRTVDGLIGNPHSQLSRLLYSLTFVRLLKKFKHAKTLVSQTMSAQYELVIELEGSWLGILWSNNHSRCCLDDRHLLVILSEMLFASYIGKPFRRVWECADDVYVFGNETQFHNRTPKTTFTLNLRGSRKVNSLFLACLEKESDAFNLPKKLPKDPFTVESEINCREAIKWGCPALIKFGSIFQ